MLSSQQELGLRYLKYAAWIGWRSDKLLAAHYREDFEQIILTCAVAAQHLNDEMEARRLIRRMMYAAMKNYGFRNHRGKWLTPLQQPNLRYDLAGETDSVTPERRITVYLPAAAPLSLREPQTRCANCHQRAGWIQRAGYDLLCKHCSDLLSDNRRQDKPDLAPSTKPARVTVKTYKPCKLCGHLLLIPLSYADRKVRCRPECPRPGESRSLVRWGRAPKPAASAASVSTQSSNGVSPTTANPANFAD